jgi:hypothetical protein
MSGKPFQIPKKRLPPRRFLVVKSETVNRVNNDRHACPFAGQAPYEPRFGIVGMDDVIASFPEEHV